MAGVEVLEDLEQAEVGSFYTIRGAGGDLAEWVNGLTEMLEKHGVGKPEKWWQTTGRAVNDYAKPKRPDEVFPDDLVILMFSLDGLNVGRLALFRFGMGDVWFDDMVQNMRRSAG